MIKHCEDCGTRMWGNACPNCQEEYCIEMEQGEFIESRNSEWVEKVKEQTELIKERESNE